MRRHKVSQHSVLVFVFFYYLSYIILLITGGILTCYPTRKDFEELNLNYATKCLHVYPEKQKSVNN